MSKFKFLSGAKIIEKKVKKEALWTLRELILQNDPGIKLIAGGPGSGKTMLGLNLAAEWAIAGQDVAWFTDNRDTQSSSWELEKIASHMRDRGQRVDTGLIRWFEMSVAMSIAGLVSSHSSNLIILDDIRMPPGEMLAMLNHLRRIIDGSNATVILLSGTNRTRSGSTPVRGDLIYGTDFGAHIDHLSHGEMVLRLIKSRRFQNGTIVLEHDPKSGYLSPKSRHFEPEPRLINV